MATDYNAIVPIPSEANHPKASGRRVFITTKKEYLPEKHYNQDSRISIGISISETEMYPNNNYKVLFPQEFNEHVPYEKKLPEVIKVIGPYAAFLAVGQHTDLYPVMIRSFGPQNANMLMDYAVYSIMTHSNVAKDFQNTMSKHLLFSKKAYSDSWLSDFFKNKLTDEQGRLFRENWILHCKDTGITKAWLCIDGSNDDCDAENMFEAESGHDKSGNGGPIVSYMWAVSSIDGTPITFFAYRGSRVDSVALKEMVAYLSSFGIETEGVILDRGFWNRDDIECLKEAKLDFIIMMKGGHGFDQMLDRHGAMLRSEDVSHMLSAPGEYGTIDKVQIFKNCDEQLYVALLYNNIRAARSVNSLTDKVKECIRSVTTNIANNQPYEIDNVAKPYICVQKFRGRKKDIVAIDDDKLQETVNRKGFAALAVSRQMSAQEVDDIYALRQNSEKQYAAFKTQLGYNVLRVYSPDSWHSKFSCGFIAGILRNEFENRCNKANVDTNTALKELSFVTMTRIRDKTYLYVRLMSLKAKAVLSELGIVEKDMSLIAEAENNRQNKTSVHPVHKLPVRDHVKRGPGRPKGSKNKKVQEKKPQAPGKRGRPKGSKNKSTLERERQAAIAQTGKNADLK